MRIVYSVILLFLLSPMALTAQSYKLLWKENFKGKQINSERWSKIPRGTSDWNNYMSNYDGCYDVSNGKLSSWVWLIMLFPTTQPPI